MKNCFTGSFQLAEALLRATSSKRGRIYAPPTTGLVTMRKALIIEDIPDLASFAAAVFEHYKFEVAVAENAEDAMEILRDDPEVESVLISTTPESEINATSLAREVASNWPAIRLFVTAKQIDRLRELPPCVFLAKPPNPRTLMSVIERWIVAPQSDA